MKEQTSLVRGRIKNLAITHKERRKESDDGSLDEEGGAISSLQQINSSLSSLSFSLHGTLTQDFHFNSRRGTGK